MSRRTRASVSPRQSCSSRIRAVISAEALACPALESDRMPACAAVFFTAFFAGGFPVFVDFFSAFFSAMETQHIADEGARDNIGAPRPAHEQRSAAGSSEYTGDAPRARRTERRRAEPMLASGSRASTSACRRPARRSCGVGDLPAQGGNVARQERVGAGGAARRERRERVRGFE